MRIDFVNQEIMDSLLDGAVSVKYDRLPDGSYIFSDEGIVAYILRENEIFFSLAKCRHSPESFKFLQSTAPKVTPENRMTPTLDVRVGTGKKLFTRQKTAHGDTFVDMDLLEAFDLPNMYQEKHLGIIAVTEQYAGEDTETVCGYVMPARVHGVPLKGYYNDQKEAQT